MDSEAPSADHETEIEYQIALDDEESGRYWLPSGIQLSNWVAATIDKRYPADFEMTLRVVGRQESRELNQQYRNIDKETNVLSFPAGEIIAPVKILGDLVICAPVVQAEAEQQNKIPEAHWAHLVVHGTLHLLGFDHEDEDSANEMEAIEISIMQILGFQSPYQEIVT